MTHRVVIRYFPPTAIEHEVLRTKHRWYAELVAMWVHFWQPWALVSVRS